jgi:hypothetical protein
MGMVIAPMISTGTLGVAPKDAGVASATVTVGQQLGASVGTSLLNTIFASAFASNLASHVGSPVTDRRTLTALASTHAYDTTFWWTAAIFAGGAIFDGLLLRRGPLAQTRKRSPAHGESPADITNVTTPPAGPSQVLR